MARRRVKVAAQQLVDDRNQDLFVLLAQQRVGKRVGRSLAVRQALTDDAPVSVDVYEGEKLGQPEERESERCSETQTQPGDFISHL